MLNKEQGGATNAEYGTKLIENLSKYLTDSFDKGFSDANLKNICQFYITYPKFDGQCPANLSWSNITGILRIDNAGACNYYLREIASQNWSYRQLKRNLKINFTSKYITVLPTEEELAEMIEKENLKLLT